MRKRWRQDRHTGELVPIEDRRPASGVMIMPDLEPYRVPGTDEWHTSRSQRRAYLRANGLEEVGNEAPKWMREQDYADRHR